MAVDTPQLRLDPYQSQVPLVQIPQQDLQPGQPLPQQAGYMGKAGSAASIADNVLKGFMRGRQVAEQKKAQQAGYAIDLSQKNETNAWNTYQDALRTGQAKQGDENDPAYKAYLQAHHATSQTMEKVAIPEEKPKGQKGQKKKADDDNQPKSFGQKLSDFMKANPHFIPQLAITARVPNKPVMTADTEQTKNTLAEQGNQLTLQGQAIESNKVKQKQDQLKLQDQEALRQVDAAGGIDKVAKDPNAPPELQMVARRAVSERLDKEGPDGQLRDKFAQDVLTGNSKNWTPADRQMAANLGYAAQPKTIKVTGKNGHEQEIMVDPQTNQPIPGSKPLDLGPPQWAQEFYSERAAKQKDIRKSVAESPEDYGVTLTGDKKTDDARIQAAADRVFVGHEQGIKAGVGTTGKTAFEVQRDNNILSDVSKEVMSRIGSKAGDKANFEGPAWKTPVSLSRQDAGNILNQFLTTPNETPGIYTFRSKPELQTGKDAGAAERDRQWAYQLVKDRMMAAKGKNAMTAQQADAILKSTALGQPITADEVKAPPAGSEKKKGFFERFWDAGPFGSGNEEKSSKGFGPPPTGGGATPGGKYYMAPGMDGPVQLSDEEVQKAKAANIPLEEVSPEILQQFSR
jgi:hypothetical protein